MFDVFTEELEVLIKDGISNLYWYKGDLKKAWLRSGVAPSICETLFAKKDEQGQKYTKRQLMDFLYGQLRGADFNRRLEISRNFVRLLIEHEDFVPQSERHRVEVAERFALKLRELITKQEKEREYRRQIKVKARRAAKENYHSRLQKIRDSFVNATGLNRQERGYALEKIFADLMNISGIAVEESFKIVGEQIDGAIKYDGHFYLVELKWLQKKCNQSDIAGLYLKAEGKLESRGLFIAMNGYSNELLKALPKGKELKVLLFDGMHISNVLYGHYTFNELLAHAISQASLKGEIYCSSSIQG